MSVTRTYDSLKRHQSLDFGHGWSVNYQDIQIQTNGQLGRHWSFEQVGSGFNRRWPMARGAWHGLTTMAGF